jgi:hypothetical protein
MRGVFWLAVHWKKLPACGFFDVGEMVDDRHSDRGADRSWRFGRDGKRIPAERVGIRMLVLGIGDKLGQVGLDHVFGAYQRDPVTRRGGKRADPQAGGRQSGRGGGQHAQPRILRGAGLQIGPCARAHAAGGDDHLDAGIGFLEQPVDQIGRGRLAGFDGNADG